MALAEQLRQAAQQQGRGVGTIVIQALTAHLAADSSPATGALAVDRSGLAEQLAAIEQRLLVLELARPASPDRVMAPSPEQAPPIASLGDALPFPDRRLTPTEAEGLLTTPEVAQALGLKGQSALTNWIARQDGNPTGRIYRGYCLRGKALLPGGQKPGWLWVVQ